MTDKTDKTSKKRKDQKGYTYQETGKVFTTDLLNSVHEELRRLIEKSFPMISAKHNKIDPLLHELQELTFNNELISPLLTTDDFKSEYNIGNCLPECLKNFSGNTNFIIGLCAFLESQEGNLQEVYKTILTANLLETNNTKLNSKVNGIKKALDLILSLLTSNTKESALIRAICEKDIFYDGEKDQWVKTKEFDFSNTIFTLESLRNLINQGYKNLSYLNFKNLGFKDPNSFVTEEIYFKIKLLTQNKDRNRVFRSFFSQFFIRATLLANSNVKKALIKKLYLSIGEDLYSRIVPALLESKDGETDESLTESAFNDAYRKVVKS